MKEGILMKEDVRFQGPFQFQNSLYFLQSSIHPEMCGQALVVATLPWVCTVYPGKCSIELHRKPAGIAGELL